MPPKELNERILILAPRGRDAELARAALRGAGLEAEICPSIEVLCAETERGIGAAISRSMAAQGADVAAGYSGNDEAAERFRKQFCDDFPDQGFSVHKGDISNADDCRRTIAEVIALIDAASASVNTAVGRISPLASLGSHCAFCSGVPPHRISSAAISDRVAREPTPI